MIEFFFRKTANGLRHHPHEGKLAVCWKEPCVAEQSRAVGFDGHWCVQRSQRAFFKSNVLESLSDF